MPKSKRPAPRKSSASPEAKEDALTQKLCDLALEIAEQEDGPAMTESLRQNENDFNKLIKKSLYQKKDESLYEALERAKDADIDAYLLLKARIEEASEIIVTARSDGKNVEVNAFLIPIFVRTVGGLDIAQCFQDQEAFDLLTRSFQVAQLESQDATVVLVNYAYHPDEVDGITFSHLNEMVRDAHASMTNMRAAAISAIERSFRGWPESHFVPEDEAVELRFLLGFALKTTDDSFYRVPDDEAAADAYFEARAKRFERWALDVAPLVKRCLVTNDAEIEVNFLYQDLFHGGKERGIAEYFMLQMMSELNHGLSERDVSPDDAKAIVAPVDDAGVVVLRVNLYSQTDNSLLTSSEKPWSVGRALEDEIYDVHDALTMIGVTSMALATKFDVEGHAQDVRPYP
jgi:hypothetical protein